MFRILFIIMTFIFSFSPFVDAAKKDWNEEKSTHFIIYYRKAPDEFVERVVEASERYYEDIIEDMGFSRYDNFWLWDNRAKIYVYDSQEDYVEASGQPGWAGGHVYSEGKVIWTYPWAAGFFDTLLPHELGHIIFRELIGYRSNIPIWLDEGVACYQEQSRRWGAKEKVKKAMDENKFINLDKLNSLKPHDLTDKEVVDLFYSESVSIITFLIERYGKYRFKTFMRSLKEAKDVNSALNSTYYNLKNLDDLGKAWEKYIKEGR